jgi:hypothetical protein
LEVLRRHSGKLKSGIPNVRSVPSTLGADKKKLAADYAD